MVRTTSIVFAGLVALCVGVGAAQAQMPTQASQPSPNQVPVAAQPGTLSVDDIKSMLEKEGFKPERLLNDKEPYLQVAIKQDGLTYPVRIYMSPSGRKVWLFIATRTLGAGEEIPQDRLLDLMDTNKRIGTGHFEYNRAFRQLQYVFTFDARGLTPEDLSKELLDFITPLKENPSVWNFTLTARK